MKGSLGKTFDQGKAIYAKASVKARLVAAASLVLAAGGLVYVATADHTDYTTLFSGLGTEDAAQITEELRKRKVPFRLASETTILVNTDTVHDLRLSLAGQGLPRGGGVGFEIFDKQKFGVSDFAQQVNYRRALQGELERTIAELDAVKAARVHIALPRRQVFARKQRQASASVTVRLHNGRSLPPARVKAVVHLLSSAVSGLPAESVTVVDTAGKMLWGGRDGGADGVLERRRTLEHSLERRVSELLDAAVGPGRAVVKVAAELGIISEERTDEQYDPERAVVRSESTAEERSARSSGQTGGVAGTQGNLPGGATASRGAGAAGGSTKRTTRNYEVARTVRRRITPAGELRRLSVAVLLDSRPPKPAEGAKEKAKGDKAMATKPLDLAAIEQVVRQAVGFSAARGDVVTVKAVPFAATPEPVEPSLAVAFVSRNMVWVALAAAAVVVIILALLLLRRRRVRLPEGELLSYPRTVRELEGESGVEGAELEGQQEQSKLPSAEQRAMARELVLAATEQDARRSAQVLRAWMAG